MRERLVNYECEPGKLSVAVADYQVQSAISYFTQGISLYPSFTELAYQIRGAAKENSGSSQAAIQDENTALQMNASNEIALFVRGEAEEDLKLYGAAMQDDNAALALSPKDEIVFVNHGNIYLQEDQYPATISDDTAAITINPSDPQAFVNRSIAEVDFGADGATISDTNQALQLNQNNATAYTAQGIVGKIEQNYTQEVAAERAALQINPSLSIAQQSLAQAQKSLDNR
jgi:tetratricopeptide (TPR) repeat protein